MKTAAVVFGWDVGGAHVKVSMVAASGQVAQSASGVDRSGLQVAAIVPSEASFDAPNGPYAGSSGGRLVSCVITRADGQKLTDRFSVI